MVINQFKHPFKHPLAFFCYICVSKYLPMKSIDNSKGVVRFSFKDPIYQLETSKKKESLIFLHFSFIGDRLKYSTGYKSCYENWDLQKQRIREGKSGILNSLEVNEFLSKIESGIKKEYSRLVAEGVPVTKILLKEYLDSFTNKDFKPVKTKAQTFFDFADDFTIRKANNVSIITNRSYKQTILKLKQYEKYYNSKLDFDSFDMVFYIKFYEFMEENDFALNTIAKHIKNLKVILNSAVEEGYTTSLKFKSRDFKAKTEETTAVYLTTKEIEQLHNLDLSKYRDLEHARDVFLIGCYTGQRISDYNGLTADSIKIIKGIKFFVIKQKKTKTTVTVPVTIEIQDIMDKRHNGLPPKKIHEQYLNDYIKQVGQQLNLSDLVKCASTRGGKENIEFIPKYNLLHSHTARRSFCTNMYIKKMPVIDIMLFSGHKTEREFYKYIRIKGEERAFHVATLGHFNLQAN